MVVQSKYKFIIIILSVVAVIALLFFLLQTSNTDTHTSIQSRSPQEMYSDFLKGKINALYEDEYLTIDSLPGYDEDKTNKAYVKYALYDMDNDDVSELLIDYKGRFFIFKPKNEQLYVWWTDMYWSGESKILNNSAIFHTRFGAAPSHTTYHYLTLDFDGKEKEHIYFEKYDSDENGIFDDFYFHDDNVSEKEWNEKTKPYFSIGSEKIIWDNYTDNFKQ